jgi:predicted amidophosphoribosyltransferase
MTTVEVQCLSCGRTNPSDARFCSSCGAPLGEAAQRAATLANAPEVTEIRSFVTPGTPAA